MTPPISRRDVIAAHILSGWIASGADVGMSHMAIRAIDAAETVIAELDRTAPRNAPKPSVTSGANDLGTVWLRSGGGPTRVYDHKADAGPGAILVRLVPVEE